jgi:hypothetical protein
MSDYSQAQTAGRLGVEALPLHLQLRALAVEVAETSMMARYGDLPADEINLACAAARRLAEILGSVSNLILSSKLPSTATELLAYSLVEELGAARQPAELTVFDDLAEKASALSLEFETSAAKTGGIPAEQALSFQQRFNNFAIMLDERLKRGASAAFREA